MRYPGRIFTLTLLLGVGFGALVAMTQNGTFDVPTALRGALHGGCITLTASAFVLFALPRLRFYRRLPAVLKMIFLTAVLVPLIFFGRALAFWLPGERPFQLIGTDPNFAGTVVFSFVLILIANFFKQLSNIIGPRTFVHLLVGRYYRSRREVRMIAYLDLVGSTATTERLGDARYLEFLNRFFRCLTPALRATGGGIHKYVGDEAIVTWRSGRGTAANGLAFFEIFQRELNRCASDFEQHFGLQPHWRGSLHYGEIVVGEMGELKKEIAFLGDSLNTGARLMDVAKTEGTALVVSGAVPGVDVEKRLRALGRRTLRGKEVPLAVYAWEHRNPPLSD